MTAAFVATSSPLWYFLVHLLRAAMALEHVTEHAGRDTWPNIYVLNAAELRAWGVLAKRARGRN